MGRLHYVSYSSRAAKSTCTRNILRLLSFIKDGKTHFIWPVIENLYDMTDVSQVQGPDFRKQRCQLFAIYLFSIKGAFWRSTSYPWEITNGDIPLNAFMIMLHSCHWNGKIVLWLKCISLTHLNIFYWCSRKKTFKWSIIVKIMIF